jgi:hypothetical protein
MSAVTFLIPLFAFNTATRAREQLIEIPIKADKSYAYLHLVGPEQSWPGGY